MTKYSLRNRARKQNTFLEQIKEENSNFQSLFTFMNFTLRRPELSTLKDTLSNTNV